jgi:hypothetical protein
LTTEKVLKTFVGQNYGSVVAVLVGNTRKAGTITLSSSLSTTTILSVFQVVDSFMGQNGDFGVISE